MEIQNSSLVPPPPCQAENTLIDVTLCVNNGKYLLVWRYSIYAISCAWWNGQLEDGKKTCLFLLMNSVRTGGCSKSDACLFAIRKRLRLENHRNKLSWGEENRLLIQDILFWKVHSSQIHISWKHHVRTSSLGNYLFIEMVSNDSRTTCQMKMKKKLMMRILQMTWVNECAD